MFVNRVLANYEFCKDASVSTQSVLEAASKENENVSAQSLGKIIKDIWEGSVSRQYSAHNCVYTYRHLRRRALINGQIISKLDHDVVKNIHGLCSLHQDWVFDSQCLSNQTSLTLLKFFSPEKGEEDITVCGRRLIFELNIILSPNPKLTLSTYGHAIPIEDIIGSNECQLSLRTIDNVMRLVDSTMPCLGHSISERANTKFLIVPVSHSKNISVCSRKLGNHERLISSSCRLLTCRSSSSCQNCAYSFKLYQNRENKRKANVLSDVPNKKCNLRYLDRIGLEEKITTQRKSLANDVKRDARAKVDDMIEFVEEDHVDLQQIVENTDSALIPPGMKLFWEQQMKQLSAKSSKGFRWNPRFAYLNTYLTLRGNFSILVIPISRIIERKTHLKRLW